MKCLVVVDMQNDFVSGALGSQDARAIVQNVVERVQRAVDDGEEIVFTRDTHQKNYLQTQEGSKLPVPHCIAGTDGWELIPELRPYAEGRLVLDKPTFGSRQLGEALVQLNEQERLEQIALIGLCTDICVISNAMVAKAFLPETPLVVEAACCAGVTPESHENALRALEVCQVNVVRQQT